MPLSLGISKTIDSNALPLTLSLAHYIRQDTRQGRLGHRKYRPRKARSTALHDADGSLGLLAEDVALGGGVGRWAIAVGVAGRDEDAEVDQPRARVELRVDGVNQEVAVDVLGLHDDDAGDELGRAVLDRGAPADDDGVAGVPEVEELEGDVGLRALALLEGLAAVEGGIAELGIVVSDVAALISING